jgi:pimeloyl-ACP methyl ester carboxylesterase
MKENLILVHSFPTNSILLAGLIEYLQDYFNVYFIDLPGFTRVSPPLKRITLKSYSRFLEKKITSLKLSSYVIGGISFGFVVVNSARLNPSACKGILAIEPYINADYLHTGFVKRYLYMHLIDYILDKKLVSQFWKGKYIDEILSLFMGYPTDRVKTLREEIEGKTFFVTARHLMTNTQLPVFKKDIPYVLIVNSKDKTIDVKPIIDLFKKNIPKQSLRVVQTTLEHYPKDVSRDYFASKMTPAMLRSTLRWLERTQ